MYRKRRLVCGLHRADRRQGRQIWIIFPVSQDQIHISFGIFRCKRAPVGKFYVRPQMKGVGEPIAGYLPLPGQLRHRNAVLHGRQPLIDPVQGIGRAFSRIRV